MSNYNKIPPKNIKHAVEILCTLLTQKQKDDLIKEDRYSHFGIGLFIRNQLLYLENPHWKIYNPDTTAPAIYDMLISRLKAETYFTKEKIDNFLQDPKQYAFATCISNSQIYMHSFMSFKNKFTNHNLLFSKTLNHAFFFDDGEIVTEPIFDYHLENDLLHINYGINNSVFKLHKDLDFEIHLTKRDDIGTRLYNILDTKIRTDTKKIEQNKILGFKIHCDYKLNAKYNDPTVSDFDKLNLEYKETFIRISDIKDDKLKEYFGHRDIPLCVFEHTVLIKCFHKYPKYEQDSFFDILNLDYIDKSFFTPCLIKWDKKRKPHFDI